MSPHQDTAKIGLNGRQMCERARAKNDKLNKACIYATQLSFK